MNITKRHSDDGKRRIVAAEDDMFDDMGEDDVDEIEEEVDIEQTLDDLSETIATIKDTLTAYEEDLPDIEVENNITDHYIAECDNCHGVFITAIEDTGTEINDISGICPLCDEESLQELKWVIRDAHPDEDEEEISL